MPMQGEFTPILSKKMVWLKMYKPVNSPVNPDTMLLIPTVFIPLLVSRGRPRSRSMTMTSSPDDTATTTARATNLEASAGNTSQCTRDMSKLEKSFERSNMSTQVLRCWPLSSADDVGSNPTQPNSRASAKLAPEANSTATNEEGAEE